MALHHKTLEAAVKKYAALVEEGKNEQEIKEAIAADEKGFDEDGVNEIYAALSQPGEGSTETEEEQPSKYITKQEFRDINNFHLKYELEDDVSHLDQHVLDRLEKLGVVTKE